MRLSFAPAVVLLCLCACIAAVAFAQARFFLQRQATNLTLSMATYAAHLFAGGNHVQLDGQKAFPSNKFPKELHLCSRDVGFC